MPAVPRTWCPPARTKLDQCQPQTEKHQRQCTLSEWARKIEGVSERGGMQSQKRIEGKGERAGERSSSRSLRGKGEEEEEE